MTTAAIIRASTAPTSLPAPALCNNQGIQWASWGNAQGDNNDPTYSNFNPEIYKQITPGGGGVTSGVGFNVTGGSDTTTIYGYSDEFTFGSPVVSHRAFVYIPQNGTYKFTATGVDDTLFVWVGNVAYDGWTRNNVAMLVSYNNNATPTTPGSATGRINMTAGKYYALRFMYVNAQGNGSFSLSITAPDGTVLVDSRTASPYVVQYSCDGRAKFGPWAVSAL